MNSNETMSRDEIMSAIEKGDRYSGVLMEEMNGKFTMIMEVYDVLDKKIEGVDRKLEDFMRETNANFKLLFEENQHVFEELRAIRKDSEMMRMESVAMRKDFSQRFDSLEGRI